MPKRVLLSWSSGKDSAWALHVLRRDGEYEVVRLLTSVNETAKRVSMHAVRLELLQRQAAAAELPLQLVRLPDPCSNEQYEAAMAAALAEAERDGIEAVAFGDLFLEDVRAYREAKLSGTNFAPLFPLWGRPTRELAREMLTGGLRAYLTCVDTEQLKGDFAGREFDENLLSELPAEIDPCGERGEFHTFCFAGPMFSRPIGVAPGASVERGRFAYSDLAPA